MLEHGGGLIAAAKQYNRPVGEWLDLSTGINPVPYPVPIIPAEFWRRLPQDDDHLLVAAQKYFQTANILPVSGSQAAIQAIPYLRKLSTVGMLSPTYNEHKQSWSKAGHNIISVDREEIISKCAELDVMVICNPNNPTGHLTQLETIENCLRTMQVSKTHPNTENNVSKWLVVDEAFMDATPNASAIPLIERYPENLIVLRSMGKFFGLAGARVGFVASSSEILSNLKEQLGPWTLTGPSRFVARRALLDTQWQNKNRSFLQKASNDLREVLQSCSIPATGHTDYFAWVMHPQSADIHVKLCKQGVLTRYFAEPSSIRFGLAENVEQLARLKSVLQSIL